MQAKEKARYVNDWLTNKIFFIKEHMFWFYLNNILLNELDKPGFVLGGSFIETQATTEYN